MDEKIFKINGDASGAITSMKDLRSALKDVQDAMAGLEEGSEQWSKLANKAGEYKHQIDAVSQSIRGASADFGDMLGNVSKVGAGMIGTFQTAQAALNLLGSESESVTKTIKTMQNMMAMTQGLTSIDAMQKSLVKLSHSIKSTTVVAKALKAVLQPKVFTAITVAITALLLIWNKFGESIKQHLPWVKKISEFFNSLSIDTEELAKKQQDLNDKYKEAKEIVEELETKNKVSKLNKEAKKSYDDLSNSIEIYDAKLKLIVVEQAKLNAKYKEGEKWKQSDIDAWKALNAQGIEYSETITNLKNQQNAILANDKSYIEIKKSEAKESYKIIDYTSQELNLQLSITDNYYDRVNIIKQIIALTKTDIANKTKELETLKQSRKYQAQETETLKLADETEGKILESKRKEVELQKQLNNEALSYFGSLKNVSDIENAITNLYGKTALFGKATADIGEGVATISNNFDLTKIQDELGVTEDVAKSLLVTLTENYNKLFELQTYLNESLVQPWNGDIFSNKDETNMLSLALQDVQKEMVLLEKTYGENVVNSEKYLQLKLQEFQIEQELFNLEKEKQFLDIELMQYQYDTGTEWYELEKEHHYQVKGEIQYLLMKIELQKEIAENAQKIYGTESIQFKSAISNLKSMKQSLESVKYAAVNVASQGIGYIGEMLNSIADLQDSTTREGFEKQKKLQIAATTVNGLGAIVSAVASWMNPANAWMTAPVQAIMAALNSAAIAGTTAAQIASIRSTQFEGGSSSVSSSGVGNLTLIPPVDYTSAVQGAEIEEGVQSRRMYVSVSEIEEVGERVQVSEQEAFY